MREAAPQNEEEPRIEEVATIGEACQMDCTPIPVRRGEDQGVIREIDRADPEVGAH
jgi:hypothetical protein